MNTYNVLLKTENGVMSEQIKADSFTFVDLGIVFTAKPVGEEVYQKQVAFYNRSDIVRVQLVR